MSATESRLIQSDQQDEWRNVLHRSFQHDFYYLPEYHRLAEDQGEGTAHLFVFRERTYQLAFPFLLRSLQDEPGLSSAPTEWRDATCVYGYTGPLASHPQVPAETVRRFQESLSRTLQGMQVITLFSRLHPFIAQTGWLGGLGTCEDTGETVSIDLTLSADAQRARCRRSHRKTVQQLRRRGVVCRRDPSFDRLDDFLKVYQETMRRVGAARRFFFPRTYFEYLVEKLGDRLRLFVCEYQGRVICAGLFFVCDGILQHHLGGTRDDALRLAPMKLLVDEVRTWGGEQGLRVFHLGGGATGRTDDSLLYFKRGFSDRRHPFLTWRWVLRLEAYQYLQRLRRRWNEENRCSPCVQNYFPDYRCPTIPGPAAAPPSWRFAAAVPGPQGYEERSWPPWTPSVPSSTPFGVTP